MNVIGTTRGLPYYTLLMTYPTFCSQGSSGYKKERRSTLCGPLSRGVNQKVDEVGTDLPSKIK